MFDSRGPRELESISPALIRPLEQSHPAKRPGLTMSIAGALRGELTHGRHVRRGLMHEIMDELPATGQETDTPAEADSSLLEDKLLRFRPRLVGAVGVYGYLSGNSYADMIDQKGLRSFYLFWALGSSQDDFIDSIPKASSIDISAEERQSLVRQAILGPDRQVFHSANRLLDKEIGSLDIGANQKAYLSGKVAGWYDFLISQEAEVLGTEFGDMSFDYCVDYRESQNSFAGSTLTALLNGKNSTDPQYQSLEPAVAKFSFLTQIIDDIADIPEDLVAQRPTFATGALIDNPKELDLMYDFVAKRNCAKVNPSDYEAVAPNAYEMVLTAFNKYIAQTEQFAGDKSVRRVGTRLFHHFPGLRNVLYRINPKAANF